VGFVKRLALDLREVARELAEEAACEAAAAAARRSGSGMRLRVLGEGRSVGSPEGGGEVGSEGMVSFFYYKYFSVFSCWVREWECLVFSWQGRFWDAYAVVLGWETVRR